MSTLTNIALSYATPFPPHPTPSPSFTLSTTLISHSPFSTLLSFAHSPALPFLPPYLPLLPLFLCSPSSYMTSDAVLSPPDLEKLRTFLVAEQASLTKRREELLQKLGSLRPPGASKVAMYEWNESAEKLHQQLPRLLY